LGINWLPKAFLHIHFPSPEKMRQDKQNGREYFPSLAWLRGLAAVLVVVSHSLRCSESLQNYGLPAGNPWLLSYFDLGTFAVCVFLTLSGATLYISNSTSSRPFSTCGYLLKRLLRIWPAFVVSLMVYGLFGIYFRHQWHETILTSFTNQYTAPINVMDAIKYVAMIFNITGPGNLFNNAFWTIPVEFQYYLMLPLLLAGMRYLHIAAPIFLGCVMLVISRSSWASCMDNPKVLMLGFTFCGGVALGCLRSVVRKRASATISWFFLAAMLLTAITLTQVPDEVLGNTLIPQKYISLGILSVITVGICLFSELHLQKNVAKLLSFLGKTSYSLYLYHNLFLGVFVLMIVRFEPVPFMPTAYLAFAFAMSLTLPTAYLSYRYIEKPAITSGRKLAEKFSGSA